MLGGRKRSRLMAKPDHPNEILTVGHSNHEERRFLELLRGGGVELLADVRVNPRSRHPQFNRSALAASLESAGIGYVHLGKELGGRREQAADSANAGWEQAWFRGYADHMASEEFAAGLASLEKLGLKRRTAVMCAEGDWRHCHRRLIADALALRRWHVLHLGPDGSLTEHELTEFAVVKDDHLTYPAPQTSLGL
jgi:uncharacterized protein (DUF488 family)